MPDFDANDELTRPPAAGSGDSERSAGARMTRAARRSGRSLRAVALPAGAGVALATPSALMSASSPAPGRHPIAAGPSSRGPVLTADDGAVPEKRAVVILHYLDVVLVVIATIPALMLGAPALGYTIGAVAWLFQRALGEADRRWIKKATTPRTQLGLNLFEAFGRIWVLAGAIVLAGVVGGRADGLTAALTIFGAYSIAFAIRVLSGP